MGVANELIAVGWGYSGFANQLWNVYSCHIYSIVIIIIQDHHTDSHHTYATVG